MRPMIRATALTLLFCSLAGAQQPAPPAHQEPAPPNTTKAAGDLPWELLQKRGAVGQALPDDPAAETAKQPEAPPETVEGGHEVDVAAVIRRGNFVQEVGEIRQGLEEAIGEALAPPADDSHKWFISVIASDGCQYCERLKHDLLNSQVLQAWVNVRDPTRSWANYQVYRWEDATQKYRWENLQIKGFPTILIQPPRSGEFGPNETVVYQRTGYDGDGEKLSNEMSDAIKLYVSKLYKSGLIEQTAYHQYPAYAQAVEQEVPPIGADPPFPVGPKVLDPRYPVGPVVEIPPGPKAATLEQLQAALPTAPPEFLLTQLAAKATVEQAVAAWANRRPDAPFSPPALEFGLLEMLIAALLLIGLGAGAVYAWQQYDKNQVAQQAARTERWQQEEAKRLADQQERENQRQVIDLLMAKLSATEANGAPAASKGAASAAPGSVASSTQSARAPGT